MYIQVMEKMLPVLEITGKVLWKFLVKAWEFITIAMCQYSTVHLTLHESCLIFATYMQYTTTFPRSRSNCHWTPQQCSTSQALQFSTNCTHEFHFILFLYLFDYSFMKSVLGKDLTKVTMPVHFNEPVSFLQVSWCVCVCVCVCVCDISCGSLDN